MKKILLLLCLISMNAESKHLGTFGHTFDIIEADLLEIIQQKLGILEKEGALAKHQTEIQERIQQQIKRPISVANIIKTKTPRVFIYDPSIKVPYDLKDHQGNIFVTAGTIVNPLDTHHLQQSLVFIDGDDQAQVDWALQENNMNTKIILINGEPFDLIDKYEQAFYYDQGGKLVEKFGIYQVPARVSQENKSLKVEEILIEAK